MKARPVPKPKKQKKKPADKLKEGCLELWSLCVRAEQKTCRNCNSDQNLSAHHIIPKRFTQGMFALDNGLTLCWSCHSKEKYNPIAFVLMIIEIIGEKSLKSLKKKYMKKASFRWTIKKLEDEKAFLKEELDRRKADWGEVICHARLEE